MSYFKQLDGLRFVAVFLVLIEHFAIQIGQYFSAGYYGVDLFFVISGFLITSILIRSQEPFSVAYKKFIGRRTIRIFPIYYIIIFLLFIIGNPHIHQWFIYCLTYTYNYASNYFNIPNNSITHLWSLAVEEQFYIFWPFLILGFRANRNMIKFIILTIILVCLIQIFFQIFKTPLLNQRGLIPQSYALCIGALGAVYYVENRLPYRLLQSKVFENVVLSVLALLLISNLQIKFLLCPILSLYFVLKTTGPGFANRSLNNFLSNKKVVYVGSISYGIYLFHLPLGYYLTNYFFDIIWLKINWAEFGVFEKIQWNSWMIKLPVYSFFSILLAHFSYEHLEKRLLSLKDKWFKYET